MVTGGEIGGFGGGQLEAAAGRRVARPLSGSAALPRAARRALRGAGAERWHCLGGISTTPRRLQLRGALLLLYCLNWCAVHSEALDDQQLVEALGYGDGHL